RRASRRASDSPGERSENRPPRPKAPVATMTSVTPAPRTRAAPGDSVPVMRPLPRARTCRRFLDPPPGQGMVGAPGLPRRPRPCPHPARVLFGLSGLVDVEDREPSALGRAGMVRAIEGLRPVQPCLDGPIHVRRPIALERRAHPREVVRIRLRRPHVLRGVLE